MSGGGQTVGVVGLGAMGLGMARTLVRRGFAVTGFDLSAGRREAAAADGIHPVETAADVFAAADVVVFSLPTAGDVESVVTQSAGAIAGRGVRRVVVVDTSTSEPDVSRALAARLAALGHGFLDAPVSGGPNGAAAGTLAMMIGGDPADLDRARPVVDALASKATHVGPSGAGNVAKLVNNLLVASHMITTREGLRLAEAAGVPAEAALQVINAATGRSALSEIHFPTWVMSDRFDSGFTMALMRKDVRLAREMAERAGASLPLTALAARMWADSVDALPDAEDFTRMGAFADATVAPDKKVA